MSNWFSTFLKRKLVGKNKNLVSIEEPYGVLKDLLQGFDITGIIDAGASNGSISRRLMRNFPRASVYGFEPNPMYGETLHRFAAEEETFKPQFLALSDQEGRLDLNVTESPGNTSFFAPGKRLVDYDPQGAVVKKTETVEVVTIDAWAQRAGNPDIQLMKFDIQGGELKAMRGASRTLRTSTLALFTEILFNPLYEGGAIFSEIDLFLREQGFVLYDLFGPKYDPRGLLLWGNAIYVHAERLGR